MKIKEKPEDFIVKEKLKLPLGKGNYAYFLLKKKQWNTINAVQELAHRLDIPEKKIQYAGIKDKQAITEQHISIEGGSKDIERLQIKDIELKYLGIGPERVHTGQLEGNEFEIAVREVAKGAVPYKHMPNYFDEQRFGVKNKNAEVGKALVKKDFKMACELLGLKAEGNHYIGELQKQGRLLNLYLHSYQSRLFNNMLSEHIKRNHKHIELSCGYEMLAFPTENVTEQVKFPLVSFDYEPEGETGKIAEETLKKEGVTARDFIIRQLPELLSQTEYRHGFAEIKNLQIGKFEDNTQNISFELQKGSYATVALKALFIQNI